MATIFFFLFSPENPKVDEIFITGQVSEKFVGQTVRQCVCESVTTSACTRTSSRDHKLAVGATHAHLARRSEESRSAGEQHVHQEHELRVYTGTHPGLLDCGTYTRASIADLLLSSVNMSSILLVLLFFQLRPCTGEYGQTGMTKQKVLI